MRAWQYTSTAGGLEKNLFLKDDVPVPTLSPRRGASEVLIEVVSATLNPADYKVPEMGALVRATMIPTPATPGLDFCGRVVRATAGVGDRARVGELVFGRIDPTQHGTMAPYVVAPAQACAVAPAGLAPDAAATLGVAGMTAYQAVAPHVKAGDRVFVNGGAGGVGTLALQIAKALGCHVTASCSAAKADLCRRLGADELIDYGAADVAQVLRDGGPTFALVVDSAGADPRLYKAADAALLPAGRYIQIGVVPSFASAMNLVSRFLRPAFLGGGKHKFAFMTVHHAPEHLEQMARWLVDGKIQPVVEETFAYEDLPKAIAKSKTGRCAGKLVIHVGEAEA
ncbi:hypothetical protein B0T26DRAFT_740343 [Lasiosphaeria miniovina]|uniref:Enoyl reductase (ER) domain-containing protein n=1 Tax=Lasiosphaeria miniovina TaxID=1954250 RepID=A0AA40AWT4_9PEZI|nr:uncharacterized protein B0T26DRAFT_740343 [Lasiosphaeria miniovina]KAK0723405.1 hypothetical protein B0T26DRAFT_740343 [Lasiosphaeria miniovina]